MISLPIEYLHLETGVLPVFLAMLFWVQLGRTREIGYYTRSGRKQLFCLVSGFLLLTAVFGIFLFNVSPLLAVELAAGCTLSLLHPVNALCFFVHLMYLRPWEIMTNNVLLLALPRLLAFLCIFSWLLHPDQHGKPTRSTVRGLLVLLVFSGWLFLSTFQSPHVAESQADWFRTYFKSLVVLMMGVFFIESEKSIREFELTFVISALALMVVGYYQFRTGTTNAGRLESVGMFGDPNDLAAVVIMAIPFALVPVFNKTAGLTGQIAGVLFTAFSMLVIWYTKSRGAMLAVVMQALTALSLRRSSHKGFKMALLVGLLGGGYFIALHAIPRTSEEMQESSESRITYWKAAVNMAIHHPFLGVGFDQYPDNYEHYASGTIYEWGRRTAHSSWFLAFAESGIPGGLLYVSFFLIALRTAWRNRRRWPAQLCALAGYGTAMSFLSHTYSLYFYLLSGLILASDAFSKRTDGGH